MKYTKEILSKAVSNSVCYAGVLRCLNLAQAGGTQGHIKRCIIKYEIDTSHFTGKAHNKGKTASNKKHWKEILKDRSTNQHPYRGKALQLRRALVESGIDYKCNKCGIVSWNDNVIVLEVDHINGQHYDDRRNNLQFLCPNCHSQK